MIQSATSGMVDVAHKPATRRLALAGGELVLGAAAYARVAQRDLPKGDALAMAEVAGILGAKQTPNLLPLCHPISLNRVIVSHALRPERHAVSVYCAADIVAQTGVEMEALTGLNVALLTIWDLAKPINPALVIDGVRLLYKGGGKSGEWRHPDGLDREAESLLASLRTTP